MAAISSEGVLRAAMAALWTSGGSEAKLRLPGLAISGNDAEQLGLGTPQFSDLSLGPVVWRKLGSSRELLVGARVVTELMGSQAVSSAESLFEGAVGIVVDGVLYAIERCDAFVAGGSACAYLLRVQPPAWN